MNFYGVTHQNLIGALEISHGDYGPSAKMSCDIIIRKIFLTFDMLFTLRNPVLHMRQVFFCFSFAENPADNPLCPTRLGWHYLTSLTKAAAFGHLDVYLRCIFYWGSVTLSLLYFIRICNRHFHTLEPPFIQTGIIRIFSSYERKQCMKTNDKIVINNNNSNKPQQLYRNIARKYITMT